VRLYTFEETLKENSSSLGFENEVEPMFYGSNVKADSLGEDDNRIIDERKLLQKIFFEKRISEWMWSDRLSMME
jgi:hypothetical protein